MKYTISKNNIEFYVPDTDMALLVKSILNVLVPGTINKLYFSGSPDIDYSSLQSLHNNGLIFLSEDNSNILINKKRLIHKAGTLTLVPVLSGIIKRNQWQPICDRIINVYNKSV